MQSAQVKQSLNAATNDVAKVLIASGIADDRDDARIILAKALENHEVRFMITKAAVNAR